MKDRSVLWCVACACAALGGCRSTNAPPVPAPPAVVVASPLVMRLAEWDEYTGRFEATDTVDVRARVNGYLDSIHFRDGAIVKPGDLLFVIDPRPYEAVMDGAQADVVRAQTRLELATTDFTRGESLFAIRGISQEELDRRVQARKEAEAALIVARGRARRGAERRVHARARADRRPHLSEIRQRRQCDLGRSGRIDTAHDDRRRRSDPVRIRRQRVGLPEIQPDERQRRTADVT
jgi:multidrug efflux pump subunit AcrA (membrane-fusion protein)